MSLPFISHLCDALTLSRVKIERLKDILQILKDNERKSKLRNQHLLQDFEKVGEYSDDLDSKAKKLKRVKVVYSA